MITPKDRIGFVKTTEVDGKTQYEYIEAKIKRVYVGKTKTSVYSDKFYALDAEELEYDTNFLIANPNLVMVRIPFITNEELANRCILNCEIWNERGARSVWEGD